MDIKDFVKSTITQISEAVKELNAELSYDGKGTIVNPSDVQKSKGSVSSSVDLKYNVTDIVFDLYVSAESGSETSGKIGIFSSIVGIGAAGKSDDSNKQVSRIQFTIPVLLPHEKLVIKR